MDSGSIQMLEFPKIREIIADFTSFSASRELALELQPLSDFNAISLLLRQSSEARRLLSIKVDFSIGNAKDVREDVRIAAKGMHLEPDKLVAIKETLAATRIVRKSLSELADELPVLWDVARQLSTHPNIENEIGRCITDTGEIADTASTRLSSVRRQIKDSHQRLLDCLNQLMKSEDVAHSIQEQFITEREGRYVIPIKAEFKKDIKGIVHDFSNSGATVFVEPWATVDLGNDLRELVIEEKQEVDRILESLSAMVSGIREDIESDVALLAELDLALAKAQYAQKVGANEPLITGANSAQDTTAEVPQSILHLVKARHPLLKGTAVPLDIEIGRDFYGLVITGPNTGGKTVALKTIGLLTLMTQAGLPIPASEESCIPVFDGVFADIGDQQSIEETLSTFSWHVGNIIHIINQSTGQSLVLLDELGISTDPNEGSALARSILLHFLARKTMVVATTHYGDLKAFAHVTPHLQNASLDFDPVTLTPTYRLTVGIPGGSNALSIAARLGLTREIIEHAREMMSQDSAAMESMLSDLLMEKQKFETMRDEVEKERDEAAALREQLEQEVERLNNEKQTILHETKEKLVQETARLYKLIRETESELRKAKKKESIERSRKVVRTITGQLEQPEWHLEAEAVETKAVTYSPGDTVKLLHSDVEGTVVSVIDDTQVEVQVGNARLTVRTSELEHIEDFSASQPQKLHVVKQGKNLGLRSLELDLRGKRADEVPGILDKYLNDAFLINLSSVRIIHGYATGTVRSVVREILDSHPLVKSYRPGDKDEGGDGVTVAML
jgi:DNA mismatch repair protein MutS2